MGCIYYNSDNEGHIMCKVTCDEHFTLEKGKGLMQGIILPYLKVEDDESEVVRNGGFGSTGMWFIYFESVLYCERRLYDY